MTFKFIGPVYFGDTITCKITLTHIEPSGRAEAEAVFTNADGREVCRAHLTGRLPGEGERELLRHMVAHGDPTNRLA
jgi:3-hydroxybutyryl-CoA dehydratase